MAPAPVPLSWGRLWGFIQVFHPFIEDFAQDGLQTFCNAKLESLPPTHCFNITARIMESRGNSLLSAADIYEEEMSNIFGPPALGDETMPRSRTLFNSMLERNKRYNARGQHVHLQRLSFYLNVIHTHEMRRFVSARNGRPLSLLELALCQELADRQYFDHIAPENTTSDLHSLCHDKIPLLARRVKDCYPFILMKLILDGADYLNASLGKLVRQAATIQITLLHQDLHWRLDSTEEGRELLNIDVEHRHGQMIEWRLRTARQKPFATSHQGKRKRKIPKLETPEEKMRYWVSWHRTKWMVIASLWEHVLVMSGVMQ